jgi:hypothetical protein
MIEAAGLSFGARSVRKIALLASNDVKPILDSIFWGDTLFKAQAAPAATNSMLYVQRKV